jgi:hypothetical protein
VAIVSDFDAVYRVARIAFDDVGGAVARDWAGTLVADACNRDAVHSEMRGARSYDSATMRGGVAQPYHAFHDCSDVWKIVAMIALLGLAYFERTQRKAGQGLRL